MEKYTANTLRYENGMQYNRCGQSGILLPKVSRNHPKQADLTWPKKKKSQGIILAISCSNKATPV